MTGEVLLGLLEVGSLGEQLVEVDLVGFVLGV